MKPRKPLPRSTKPIKRSPLPRPTRAIRSRKPIQRSSKPIRSQKKDPKTRRFAKLRDPAYQDWVRTQPCVVGWVWAPYWKGSKQCSGSTECAHVVSRGAGGADRKNVVPLCRRHHREQHAIGTRSFQRLNKLDLAEMALTLDQQYEALQ